MVLKRVEPAGVFLVPCRFLCGALKSPRIMMCLCSNLAVFVMNVR